MTRGGSLAILVFLLAGCRAVGPNYVPPAPALPARYAESRPDSAPRTRVDWWHDLGDPALDALVAEARSRSFDLRIVAARVDEARALRSIAIARQFPPVDVTASAQKIQDSGNSVFFTEPMQYGQLRTGLESSWELDFWGRVRREVRASTADMQAVEAMLADAFRTVVAQVATEYVDLRGAERELLVTASNLETQRGTLKLTEDLARDGLGIEADVARSRGLVHETESLAPPIESRIAGGAHRLAVLTGTDVETVRAQLAHASTLPVVPPFPALGVPSELAQARPDIRAAERALAAATERIGVAVADLYPQITLNGRFGVEATDGARLFETNSISFGVGPALRWPAIDYGTVRNRICAQGARARAALAEYERVVASALMEVETSIASLLGRQKSRDSLAGAVEANREAARLVEARFREGAGTFLDVLDAQRRVLLSEAMLARAETLVLLDYVTLRRALG
jgi:outer membrane protein, multidrug efflux system